MSDSRAEFEAWARRENLPLVPECCDKSPNGDYRFLWMQSNWLAWQASRAQPESKLTTLRGYHALRNAIDNLKKGLSGITGRKHISSL